MKIGVIIQARTTSTRLPSKVLLNLPYGSKITVLQQVIRRVKRAKQINRIVIATTTKKVDDVIVKIAKKEGVDCFRGSESNVLERYYLAARKYKLDTIVRVTSDCPCIDPAILDKLIITHQNTKADFTSNCLTKTFPHGVDAEVFKFATLETAYKNATLDFEKEHVSEYILNNPKRFKIVEYKASKKYYAPNIRITLDTKEDYTLFCLVFLLLYKRNHFFGTKDIIDLFTKNPWMLLINKPTQ